MNVRYSIFTEVQRFRLWWVWILVLFVSGIAWYGAIHQIVLKKPFGNNPAPDAVMIMIWAIFGLFFPILFYSLKLVTEVRYDGLYVRFFPLQFHSHKISYGDIKNYEVRTYSAIKEYGGYGIRYGTNGKAYNVYGNKGIQIEFQDGKRLLVGSQRPEEFEQALETVIGRKTSEKRG
ncbi:MAG: hypothetical protein JSV17_13330 [Candidatus Aminicenantes bacterium]|nr:MAG: hypothetical protein JSV17_13330 [Candidatus Aminicenantes bacterium]